MQHLVALLRELHAPWLVGMGANMDPDTFADNYWVWFSGGVVRAPATVLGTCRGGGQARVIDFFLVDANLADLVQTVGPCEPWDKSYDHKAVSMRVDLDKVTYGSSFWKFNNSFLEDIGYLQKVDDQIVWAIYTNQKANPEGGRLSIRDISLLSKRERSQVELEVNPHAFMETLLNQIKHISRQHGRAKKISQARTREDLNDKLRRALETEKQLLLRIDNEEWTLDLYTELALHQEEVEAIRSQLRVTEERINEGAYIRTGYDWKCESEAPYQPAYF